MTDFKTASWRSARPFLCLLAHSHTLPGRWSILNTFLHQPGLLALRFTQSKFLSVAIHRFLDHLNSSTLHTPLKLIFIIQLFTARWCLLQSFLFRQHQILWFREIFRYHYLLLHESVATANFFNLWFRGARWLQFKFKL